MGNGIYNQLRPTERRILGYGDKTGILAQIAYNTDSGTLKELLRILTKQQDGSPRNLFHSVNGSNIAFVGTQIGSSIFGITYFLAILRHEVEVNVINRCSINRFILIIAATLGIEQLHAHLEVQFLRFITYPIESTISLIGMYLHTGSNMHHQHSVGKSVYIRTINEMHFNIHRRNTEVERSTQQFVQMFFIAIDACDTSVVLNAYHHIATIGIGKGN